MPLPGADAAEGLRERKKRRTRQEISDVATRLFFEHGFEEVTLAAIADAAEVSVKTIFNHFGSKEDLYFDRNEEFLTGLRRTVAERPAGTTVLRALRGLLADNAVPFPGEGWAMLENPVRYAGLRVFLATQDRSPALRARRLLFGEELAAELASLVGAEVGRDAEAPEVRAVAAMLVAAFEVRHRAMRAAVAAQCPAPEVRRQVTAVVGESFDRLERAFADLDRPAPPRDPSVEVSGG